MRALTGAFGNVTPEQKPPATAKYATAGQAYLDYSPDLLATLNDAGASGDSTAADAAKVGAATVGAASTGLGIAAATATEGAGTVTALLTSAGVASSVPVAGWIVAGGLVAASATIAIVMAVLRGNKRKAEAVEWARQLGLPEPEKLPGFIASVRKWSPSKQEKYARSYAKQLTKTSSVSKARKLQSKLRVLATLRLINMSIERGQMSPPPPATVSPIQPTVAEQVEADQEPGNTSTYLLLGALGVLGAVLVLR